MFKIWHNPRCSKSRMAKDLLEEKNIDFEIIEYLKKDITKDDILELMELLEISDIRDMLRSKEDLYQKYNIQDVSLSNADIIDIVLKNPKLIERPIIIKDCKAVIARPCEKILELF